MFAFSGLINSSKAKHWLKKIEKSERTSLFTPIGVRIKIYGENRNLFILNIFGSALSMMHRIFTIQYMLIVIRKRTNTREEITITDNVTLIPAQTSSPMHHRCPRIIYPHRIFNPQHSIEHIKFGSFSGIHQYCMYFRRRFLFLYGGCERLAIYFIYIYIWDAALGVFLVLTSEWSMGIKDG